MLKTINLGGGREIRLSSRNSWLFEYRDQFGQDIIPALMPALIGISKGIAAFYKEAGSFEEVKEEHIAALIEDDILTDMGIHLTATGGATGIYEIAWAMAKAADPTIPDPRTWIREIEGSDEEEDEELPLLDIITPAVFELLFKGVTSANFLNRLQKKADKLRPKKTKKETEKNPKK